MKKIFVCTVLSLLASVAFAQQKERVAVQPFTNRGEATLDDARMVTELVRSRIGASGVVEVVTRDDEDFSAILHEHRFQTSDWSNPNKTAELGAALGAEYILIGSITRSRGSDAFYLVKARMINLNTTVQVASTGTQFDRIREARGSMNEFTDMFIQALSWSDGARPSSAARAAPVPATMVRIRGDIFLMGSPSTEVDRSDRDREAQHWVRVSAFYMGQYEVTQAEYEAVTGSNPSIFKGGSLPVENVSWFDAVVYCNKRSAAEGLTPAYTINGDNVTWNRSANGYRLPTEAEWEYACRAGTATPFSTGYNISTSQANYNGYYPYANNPQGTYRDKTTDVGSFVSNSWGLYDMHGNVWEWCWDWDGGYSMADQTDPPGAASGFHRVLRGGSWFNYATNLRSAYRDSGAPSYHGSGIGFRVVRP